MLAEPKEVLLRKAPGGRTVKQMIDFLKQNGKYCKNISGVLIKNSVHRNDFMRNSKPYKDITGWIRLKIYLIHLL